MNIDVDKIVVSLDVVTPDAVVVEASAVAPSGIVTEAVAELPTQVIVISHEETPTVTPLQIIDYGSSSIECAFDVTTEQAEEVVKGVLCGTVNPPTFENADYRLLHGQGSMDLAFAGLHQNTEYYLRPYALSNLGYKYGDVVAQRTKANPIPDEYQLVEYLENPGYSYINLNKTFALGCNAKLKVVHKAYNNYNTYLGAYTANGGIHNILRVRNYNGKGINPCIGTTSAVILKQGLFPTDEIEEFEIGNFNNIVSYKDANINTQQNVAGSYSTFPFFLFGLNFSGSVDYSHSFVGKMYYCLIVSDFSHTFDNPNLALYPVYRKSDNKPGMYDIVNNAFYTNQGSGEFTVGPDKEWEE